MVNPPYIYDSPSKYSFTGPSEKAWNPRAATQASWEASMPSPPRPKKQGPLIDAREFNRHPDSYFVVPYGNLNWKPMSPRTKKKVKYTRQSQLFLRICELLGAVGLLFCVICIKGTQGSTGWIIRVPAGVAILHTIYAIYHLARSASARTPASSASYMIFAAILDVGLIPFLVFTAMLAQSQFSEPADTAGRWTSLFMFDTASTKIFHATFLISTVNGAMHFCSLSISLYLAVLFRKISRLPPDMNPLEDNLTSRHKRNKSSLLDDSENRQSKASSRIAAPSTKRTSSQVEDPLISPVRTLPFMHTRNESNPNISNVPHPNFSPRVSRTDISASFYNRPSSRPSSRPGSFYNQAPSQRASQANLNSFTNSLAPALNMNTSQNTEAVDIRRSPTKSSSVYSDTTRPTSTRPQSTAPPSLPRPDDNWISYPSPTPSPPPEFKHLLHSNTRNIYQSLPQQSPPLSKYSFNDENLVPRPLEMNPPTPVNQQHQQQRILTSGTGNTLGFGTGRAFGGPPVPMKEGRGRVQNGGYGDLAIGGGEREGFYQVGRSDVNGREGTGRVISRSGAEVEKMNVRARDVSGRGPGTEGGWDTRTAR
ncbi:MAG: hypothetical protein Q9190_001647 [Brigantiaea leucoxantha]